MSKYLLVVGMALALAGCGGGSRRAVAADVRLDADAGTVTLNCKESTSGSCYGVVIGAKPIDVVAKAGTSATVSGITPGARFCIGDARPDPAKCSRSELRPGSQIVRVEQVHS